MSILSFSSPMVMTWYYLCTLCTPLYVESSLFTSRKQHFFIYLLDQRSKEISSQFFCSFSARPLENRHEKVKESSLRRNRPQWSNQRKANISVITLLTISRNQRDCLWAMRVVQIAIKMTTFLLSYRRVQWIQPGSVSQERQQCVPSFNCTVWWLRVQWLRYTIIMSQWLHVKRQLSCSFDMAQWLRVQWLRIQRYLCVYWL